MRSARDLLNQVAFLLSCGYTPMWKKDELWLTHTDGNAVRLVMDDCANVINIDHGPRDQAGRELAKIGIEFNEAISAGLPTGEIIKRYDAKAKEMESLPW